MKKFLKFTGIALVIIAIILLLIIGYAHGKRFLAKRGYKDNCPAYISVTAEFIKTKLETSIISEKISNLRIGNVAVKPAGENKVEIILSSYIKSSIPLDSQYQMVVATFYELGLQETKMKGISAYSAKTCYGDENPKK